MAWLALVRGFQSLSGFSILTRENAEMHLNFRNFTQQSTTVRDTHVFIVLLHCIVTVATTVCCIY